VPPRPRGNIPSLEIKYLSNGRQRPDRVSFWLIDEEDVIERILRHLWLWQEGVRVHCGRPAGRNDPRSVDPFPATRPTLTTTNQLASTVQTDRAFLAWPRRSSVAPASLSSSSAKWSKAPLSPSSRRSATRNPVCATGTIGSPLFLDTKRTRRKEAAAAGRKAELGDVPVPPKYGSGAFNKAVWWSLRGKLDVPKERRISYSTCSRGSSSAQRDGSRVRHGARTRLWFRVTRPSGHFTKPCSRHGLGKLPSAPVYHSRKGVWCRLRRLHQLRR
jgi:hypothetical protein